MSRRTPTEELLAAYADEATDADESRRVEALLERSADARDELAALRETLGAVRAAEPMGEEPHWGAMTSRITAALDEVDEARAASPWARLRRWLRPTVAFPLVAAAAAIVLYLGLRERDAAPVVAEGTRVDAAVLDTGPVIAEDDTPTPPAIEAPVDDLLDDAEDDELDAVVASLDALEAEPAGVDLLEGIDEVLADELDESGDLAWVDDLGDDELAELDDLLDELMAG